MQLCWFGHIWRLRGVALRPPTAMPMDAHGCPWMGPRAHARQGQQRGSCYCGSSQIVVVPLWWTLFRWVGSAGPQCWGYCECKRPPHGVAAKGANDGSARGPHDQQAHPGGSMGAVISVMSRDKCNYDGMIFGGSDADLGLPLKLYGRCIQVTPKYACYQSLG